MSERDFPATLLRNERHVVYGLGVGGRAAVRRLLGAGARVYALDGRGAQAAHESLGDLTAHPGLSLTEPAPGTPIASIILSPGIPASGGHAPPFILDARKNGIPVLSEIDMFFDMARRAGSKARFVSITGTNGKSTTTALAAFLLERAGIPSVAGGNLGPAAMSLPLLGDEGVYVIEMSSYALERLRSYAPEIAAWLNFTPDHLERHGGMAGYFDAKTHVFDRLADKGLAILGRGTWTEEAATRLRKRSGASIHVLGTQEMPEAPNLPGRHNKENIEAAWQIARHFEMPDARIHACLGQFRGLPHRMERCGGKDGVYFINDSKATNAEAAKPALESLDDVYWIVGGLPKDGDIGILEHSLDKLRHAFIIGRSPDIFARRLQSWGFGRFTVSHDLDAAFEQACVMAFGNKGGNVLLSPSAASQDQFKDFEERGARFKSLVQARIAKNQA